MIGQLLFECRPIPHGSFTADAGPSYFTTDVDDAVAWATANVTRLVEQITIDVHAPGDVSTFAIRHICHDGTDSGWRCWRDGDFVGAVSLDRLFHPPVMVS